jgi:hypothetical protein
VAECLLTAVLGARARRVQPDEPAEHRRAHLDAAEQNMPLDPNREQCNAKGEIVTPLQRCVANTQQGKQCGPRTTKGCLCWQRVKKELQVRIKKSPVSGNGLFADRDFATGEPVVNYTGDLGIGEQDEEHGGSRYVIELTRHATIDAARRNSGPARMVNDPKGTGKRPNFVWNIDNQRKKVRLSAIRPIEQGDDLLISYCPAYFRTVEDLNRRLQLKKATSAIAPAHASKLE